ncbi:MAG: hypothetical protein ACRD2L_09205, partial [Terriglobia bacterium]
IGARPFDLTQGTGEGKGAYVSPSRGQFRSRAFGFKDLLQHSACKPLYAGLGWPSTLLETRHAMTSTQTHVA